MAISSGDMVLIAETDRFIDARNQVATTLFNSISDEIVDFNSMVEAIKRVYGEDPSLQSLISSGGITERGWMAIFEHPKTQRLLRKNTFDSKDPNKIRSFEMAERRQSQELDRVKNKISNTVGFYIKQRSSNDFLYYRKSPETWSKVEESYLENNKGKYSTGVLFLKYNKIFGKKRSISSVRSKLSRLNSDS